MHFPCEWKESQLAAFQNQEVSEETCRDPGQYPSPERAGTAAAPLCSLPIHSALYYFLAINSKMHSVQAQGHLVYFCVSPFAPPPFCLFKLHGVSKFSNNTLTKFQEAPESQEPLVPKDRRLETILLNLTTSNMLWQMRSGEVGVSGRLSRGCFFFGGGYG